MNEPTRRSTIYLDARLHDALRLKAVHARCSISDLVNEAVRASLAEDADDLAAFEKRIAEPTMTYEALLDDLKAHGKL